MLTLMRKSGERVVISGPCVMRVQCMGPTRVKLSFHAPDTTKILREEIVDVAGGNADCESLLSAAGLGGGLGDEIADSEGGV